MDDPLVCVVDDDDAVRLSMSLLIETLGLRALYDARPLEHNGYKVDVASAALSRAIAFLEGR